MSVSTARSAVSKDQKDIADLRSKDAQEARKEADLTSKMNRAASDARTTKSISTMTSKLRDVERAANDLASVQKRRADLAKGLADKTADLNRRQQQLDREEDSDRKRIAAEDKRLQDARAKQIKELGRQLQSHRNAVKASQALITRETGDSEFDVFISHASEDKDAFVRELAEKLVAVGLKPFYDEMSLKWGDSLRRAIDKGLARSRFGVVVLSEHFFRKEWPQRELDGLVQMEIQGQSRILPIWHKVSKDEVARFSPTLADKLALNTAVMTVDEIVNELLKVSGRSAS